MIALDIYYHLSGNVYYMIGNTTLEFRIMIRLDIGVGLLVCTIYTPKYNTICFLLKKMIARKRSSYTWMFHRMGHNNNYIIDWFYESLSEVITKESLEPQGDQTSQS